MVLSLYCATNCLASNDSNKHDLKSLFAVHNRIKIAKHPTTSSISFLPQ